MLLGIGGLLAVTYGAAIAGSEWSWGTLKAAVARGESRTRYTLLGYGGVAVFAIVGVFAAFVVGVGARGGRRARSAGVSLEGMGDAEALGELPELFARGSLAIGDERGAGVRDRDDRPEPAGRHRRRHRRVLRRGDRRHLPPHVDQVVAVRGGRLRSSPTGSRRGDQRRASARPPLDPNTAVIVVAAWLVGALVVSSLWTERAEIGG